MLPDKQITRRLKRRKSRGRSTSLIVYTAPRGTCSVWPVRRTGVSDDSEGWWWREPPGGRWDGANSPARKLIIENIGKIILLLGEITWLPLWMSDKPLKARGGENIRQTEAKERAIDFSTLAEYSSHKPLCPNITQTHTLLWRVLNGGFFLCFFGLEANFLFFLFVFLKVTQWKQIIKQTLKTTSKARSEDAFEDNALKQGCCTFQAQVANRHSVKIISWNFFQTTTPRT